MGSISVEELLTEISPEQPSGENLEYDASYLAVQRILQGKPERVMGDEVVPAEEADWRKLREETVSLLGRTKDLRLSLGLTVALLKLEGLPGLRDGLAVVRGLIEKYWETVYPQLDPDDDNDPTERVNIIDGFAQPPHTVGDPYKFQQRLREVPLCESKQIGRFSLRDIQVARGEITPTGEGSEEEATADLATIEAAFMDSDEQQLTEAAGAIQEAVESAESIEAVLTEHVGAGNATDLSSFTKALKEIQSTMVEYLSKRGVAAPGAEGAEEGGGSAGEGAAAAGPALSGEVRSRQDVLNAIDKINRYYDQHEPSSPVPILLNRARKLATMNFIEIIENLSPSAMPQIQVISGVDSESEGG